MHVRKHRTLHWTSLTETPMNFPNSRNRLFWYACVCLIVAAAVRATYAVMVDPSELTHTSYWTPKWIAAYTVFVVSYALTPNDGAVAMTRRRMQLLLIQALSAVALVWLYPSFVVTFLLIVVVWQLALLLDFPWALAATTTLVVIMGIIQCEGETRGKLVLVVATCAGLQYFAMCAAQLVRSEIFARQQLARANAELQAAQSILREGARLSERLRIARDLHDTVGHSLTTLSVHLDVAQRLTDGPATEHVVLARAVAGDLLNQVRDVVSRFRVEPLDLRIALERLAAGAQGLRVSLRIADNLAVADTATAEAIVHCVQEAITNTIRHAYARELVVEVFEQGDELVVKTHDDGRGGAFRPGNGLKGMRERFEELGGKLAFESNEGRGFTVEGVLPMTGNAS